MRNIRERKIFLTHDKNATIRAKEFNIENVTILILHL